jgi:hypothetical protein
MSEKAGLLPTPPSVLVWDRPIVDAFDVPARSEPLAVIGVIIGVGPLFRRATGKPPSAAPRRAPEGPRAKAARPGVQTFRRFCWDTAKRRVLLRRQVPIR